MGNKMVAELQVRSPCCQGSLFHMTPPCCPAAPRSDKEAEADEAKEAAAKAEADKEARRVSKAAASRAQLVSKLQYLLKQVGTSAAVNCRCDFVSSTPLHLLQQVLWSHLHGLTCC